MRASLDRFVVTFGAVLAVIVFCAALFGVARGEQPECTGDRHYDGVACCPDVSTTTTTVPDQGPRVDCPDPAPCPTVECKCGEGTTVNNVTVNRCPEAPIYVRCRKKADGTMKCPIKDHPGRRFVPEPSH
jgi:hypothetical protein